MTYQTTVCVQRAGGTGPGKCAQGRGILPAQVFTPYRPGTAYTSTGSGCATRGNPPEKFCAQNGPSTVTL